MLRNLTPWAATGVSLDSASFSLYSVWLSHLAVFHSARAVPCHSLICQPVKAIHIHRSTEGHPTSYVSVSVGLLVCLCVYALSSSWNSPGIRNSRAENSCLWCKTGLVFDSGKWDLAWSSAWRISWNDEQILHPYQGDLSVHPWAISLPNNHKFFTYLDVNFLSLKTHVLNI